MRLSAERKVLLRIAIGVRQEMRKGEHIYRLEVPFVMREW